MKCWSGETAAAQRGWCWGHVDRCAVTHVSVELWSDRKRREFSSHDTDFLDPTSDHDPLLSVVQAATYFAFPTHSFDAFHKITEINRNTITQQQIVFQYFAYWLAHSSNYTLDSHSIFQYEWHKPLPSARSKWISSINLKIIVTYLSDQ